MGRQDEKTLLYWIAGNVKKEGRQIKDYRFFHPVFVLLFQICLFPVKKIHILELSGFDIFIQALHGLPYHISRNLFQRMSFC